MARKMLDMVLESLLGIEPLLREQYGEPTSFFEDLGHFIFTTICVLIAVAITSPVWLSLSIALWCEEMVKNNPT